MKKILTLLITTILLTGCHATYDINMTKDTINDTITIMTKSNNVNNASDATTDKFQLKLGEWENGHDFYKREIITTAEKTGYQYTYSFKYNEYDAMSQIRKCYDKFELNYENEITLSTSNEFLCKTYYPEVKTYIINITSEYEITDSNADYINNNTHTWKVNANNYKNKPINIKINKEKKYKKETTNNNDFIKRILFIIFFIALVVILIKRRKDIIK